MANQIDQKQMSSLAIRDSRLSIVKNHTSPKPCTPSFKLEPRKSEPEAPEYQLNPNATPFGPENRIINLKGYGLFEIDPNAKNVF
jgi:hypothetical protein